MHVDTPGSNGEMYDFEPSTSVEAGLRAADMLVRVGDRSRAFDMYLRVAERYARDGHPLEAVAVGFRALALDPASFASTRVAALLREIGESAAPLCLRSIHLQLEADRFEAAVLLAEVMVVLDPSDLKARHDLADLYIRTERRDEAVALLTSTCRRLSEAGRDRDLISTARLLLRVEPGHAPTLRDLTHACLGLGQPATALATAAKLVAETPDDPESFELLAWVYIELDRPSDALATLRRLAEAFSDPDAVEHADLVLVRAHGWSEDDTFNQGIAQTRAQLRACLHAALHDVHADPLAAVPDAPELLDAGSTTTPSATELHRHPPAT